MCSDEHGIGSLEYVQRDEQKTTPKLQVDHDAARHVFASTSLGKEPEFPANQTAAKEITVCTGEFQLES